MRVWSRRTTLSPATGPCTNCLELHSFEGCERLRHHLIPVVVLVIGEAPHEGDVTQLLCLFLIAFVERAVGRLGHGVKGLSFSF